MPARRTRRPTDDSSRLAAAAYGRADGEGAVRADHEGTSRFQEFHLLDGLKSDHIPNECPSERCECVFVLFVGKGGR